MDLGLANKRAVVTGGTKGIGRAIVETLATEGCHVAFCARNAAEVEATSRALAGRGIKVFGRALDVGDGAALKAWVDDAARAFGGLDIAIANVSALATAPGEQSWQQAFNIDILGTIRLVEAAIPHLEQSDSGAIVNIASTAGREVDAAAGSYGAMKAALIHYTKGLAHRLAAKRIRANVVSPGTIYFDGGVWDRIKTGLPDRYANAMARNPLGRMGTPEEVASAAAFLASPRASFTTGTNLLVDGAITRGVQF